MKVIATAVGFYSKLQKVGDSFEIKNEKAFSKKWMKKAGKKKKEDVEVEETETETESE